MAISLFLPLALGAQTIHGAALAEDYDAVLRALEAGASPNSYNRSGFAPLHSAARGGSVAIAELLLDNGADVNIAATTASRDTPLHLATINGNEAVVDLLLQRDADPNLRNAQGNTPLHEAAIFGSRRIVRNLLRGGADRTITNEENQTAADISDQREDEEVLEELEDSPGPSVIENSGVQAFDVGETIPEGLAAIGNTLYMLGASTDALYTLDAATGAATRVGSATQFGVNESAPTGLAAVGTTLYMVGEANDALYTLNTATGEATRVGSMERFGVDEYSPTGLAAVGNTLYMAGQTNRALYTLDTSTGVATRIGSVTQFGVGERIPEGLAAIGSTLYMVGQTNDALYTLNAATGEATRVGSATRFGVSETFPAGLAAIGSTLYMVGQINDVLYALNTSDGIATPRGGFGYVTSKYGGTFVAGVANQLWGRTLLEQRDHGIDLFITGMVILSPLFPLAFAGIHYWSASNARLEEGKVTPDPEKLADGTQVESKHGYVAFEASIANQPYKTLLERRDFGIDIFIAGMTLFTTGIIMPVAVAVSPSGSTLDAIAAYVLGGIAGAIGLPMWIAGAALWGEGNARLKPGKITLHSTDDDVSIALYSDEKSAIGVSLGY